jgi:glycosyltransferase involved in cell wall biosynthesis
MKILLIAPEFPPNTSVGCIRPVNLCNYFALKNNSVTVITSEYNQESDFSVDLSLLDTINNDVIIHRLPSSTYSKKFITSIKSIFRSKNSSVINTPNFTNETKIQPKIKQSLFVKILDFLSGSVINFFNFFFDYPDHYNVFSSSLASNFSSDFYQSFDVVICTAPPFSHLKKIADICSKHNIPCVADYRDLFFDDVLRPSGFLNRMRDFIYETSYIHKFDHIVCVSKTKRLDIIKNFKINEKSISVINNPFTKKFLGSSFSLQTDDLLVFTYTGRLYRERNLATFFSFIKYLHEIPNFRKVQVNIAGYIEQPILASILLLFKSLHRFELNILGSLPRQQALELQEKAHFLVLTLDQGTTSDGVIPAKVYEYLSSGKPTICFEVNKDVQDIFNETNAGSCSLSFSEQLAFVNNIICDGYNPDLANINQFHISNVGENYLKILHHISTNKTNAQN